MSATIDVLDTIRTLATLVRLHEGNRDPAVNALLLRADECAAAVAELIEAVETFERIDRGLWAESGRADAMRALYAALARIGAA